jgi:signal transduction histidine kinase/ActR/RegA family two-component response regulator
MPRPASFPRSGCWSRYIARRVSSLRLGSFVPSDDHPSRPLRRRQSTTQRGSRGDDQERARLVVLAGGPVGRRYAIDKETIVGRSSQAVVQIDQPALSRRHVCIRRVPDGWEIEDLGSLNGTQVNEQRVTKGPLQFGDQIELGAEVLLLFTQHDSLKDQILQRQRLEALGRLSAGVTHDFNNMLGAIVASLDYALLNRPPGHDDPDYIDSLDDARAAAERASELCSRLLAFVLSDAYEHRRVDLSALCKEVINLVERTVGRAIEVETAIADDLGVIGDAASLHQVLMNLCLNARDAMPDGGALKLSASQTSQNPPMVVLTVRDDGMGMTAATRARIFEPFFTTKPSAGGFGLGLATAKETVEAHGGTLEVATAPNQGSTFTVTLPAVAPESIPPESQVTVRPPQISGQLIMLVDDEDIVRRATRRLLTSAGYQVIEARDGAAALRLYEESDPRPEVVLLDLEMPIMNGVETLRRLKALDKNVRVLIVSGHADVARLDAPTYIAARGVVPKPCGAGVLIGAVALALESPLRHSSRPTLGGFPRVTDEEIVTAEMPIPKKE